MDAQLLVVQKLEEKEGVLQSTLAALEKELSVRTQALELNKRKVRKRRAVAHHSSPIRGRFDGLQMPLRSITRWMCSKSSVCTSLL